MEMLTNPAPASYLFEPRAGGRPHAVRAAAAAGLGRVVFVELQQVEILVVRELHLLDRGVEGGRPLLQIRPDNLRMLNGESTEKEEAVNTPTGHGLLGVKAVRSVQRLPTW